MAELIDKGALVGFIEKNFDIKCTTEHGQGYVDAMHDMKDVIIALIPTTTEAEIRAKAIDEFAEKLGRLCENSAMALDRYNTRPLYNKGGKWNDLINDVAEQLKGE